MKLTKDGMTITLNDEDFIAGYKNSGWVEVKSQPKKKAVKKPTK